MTPAKAAQLAVWVGGCAALLATVAFLVTGALSTLISMVGCWVMWLATFYCWRQAKYLEEGLQGPLRDPEGDDE